MPLDKHGEAIRNFAIIVKAPKNLKATSIWKRYMIAL
jgi:hypothetical protein